MGMVTTVTEGEEDGTILRQLQEAVDSHPDDPSTHFNLGVLLWEKGDKLEIKEKAAEHFVLSAKLNPQNGAAFRYLGHYYSHVSGDSQRALKCYQRAITLNPDDSDSGEALCNLLDESGKESLELAICREASGKSPKAFWAFRRLGYLQIHQKCWSDAIQSLQHAIRGYPICADLWEALGLAYQQMGMLTAANKSYARAIELEDWRVFALVESGNIFSMLGSFRKGIEQFRQALQIAPLNMSAHYGLASTLLSLAQEYTSSGAFRLGASLLEEASRVAMTCTSLAGNVSSVWKLHGDIQLMYAKSFPWMEEGWDLETDEKAFHSSVLSWKNTCLLAAISGFRSYQRALHLVPWQANLYTDIAIATDLVFSMNENQKKEDRKFWSPSEKMCVGGLLLEGENKDFWVTLGCLADRAALKQHALIRGLQLEVSLAVAWAYLGKLYREEGYKQLSQQAFDRARSIEPSLALPWAGMSADADVRKLNPEEAYECCLRAVQISPLADFQTGLVKLALLSGHLPSSEVFGSVRQALQRAPHYPESQNLSGLVCEARCDYERAVASYRLARYSIRYFASKSSKQCSKDISVNLARSLCRAGNAADAVNECEDLKREGPLDPEVLQIYAICLWQVGKGKLALSVAKTLATDVLSMERTMAAVSLGLICRLLYNISGLESAIASILKMPRELFQTSKVSFVVSAIHALDQSDQLQSVVSISRSALASNEEITAMHFLIALSKLIKHGSQNFLDIQKGVDHLRKFLHIYPNSCLLRNLLGYLLLSSKEWNYLHIGTRCISVDPVIHQREQDILSAFEIIGAVGAACYSTGSCPENFTFATCTNQWPSGPETIRILQKYLHQEPWNHNTRYLLLVNHFQMAREKHFPQHLCSMLERQIDISLSDQFCSRKGISHQYQRFQLLLCAAEINLQLGNHRGCIKHAENAAEIMLPDSYLFFSHLLLCRAFAAEGNFIRVNKEYGRCLELKTDYHVGWISLKFLEAQCQLKTDSLALALNFEECSKEIKGSWHMWTAVFNMVQGLIARWVNDFLGAEELFGQACSNASNNSGLFLCYGAICMELARKRCSSEFLSLAARSLKKAMETSIIPLPIVSLLLAQAEASLGSKRKWEENLHIEWSSWPPEMMPAEILFQMHLLSAQKRDGSNSLPSLGSYENSLRWILQAIHLNPSCLRYWKVLQKLTE